MSQSETLVEWALKGSMLSEASQPRGSVRIGPCEILSLLGTGDSGPVYKAYHTKRAELVAVKILPHRRLAAGDAQRFKKEVARYSTLDHPHLVKILDGGVDQDRCYLVLELVEGETLSEVMKRSGPMSPHQAIEQAEGLASALSYLHKLGLSHGGIRPSSILVAHDGTLKLGNIGPAWLHDLPLYEKVEVVAESMIYVALEDTSARPTAADMFVLGMVLHRMLVGFLPHGITNFGELIEWMGLCEPTPIGDLMPGIPARLQDLVGELLNIQPEERPTSQDVLSRLRRMRTGEAEALPTPKVIRAASPASRISGGKPAISVRGQIRVSQALGAQPAPTKLLHRQPSLMDRLRSSFLQLAQRVAGAATAS